jgi:thiol-disulfide isomerase/thioredoxin
MNRTMKKLMNNKVLMSVLVLVLVALGALYVMRPKENFNDEEKCMLNFFYVDWCPHCKTAKPEVEKLEKELAENNGALKGTNVKVQVNKINPEENDANRQKAEKNNVNAYPTVVIEDKNGGVKAELETGVTLDNLRDFIKNNL